MREFLPEPFQEHLGASLVQVDYRGWTVSVHRGERSNLLWVRDLVFDANGRRVSTFLSRAQDEPAVHDSFVRLGGRYRGNWCSVSGKLPVRAAKAEGYCGNGLPVIVSVEDDLFCSIMPRYQPVVLRFWANGGCSVQEYRVDKEIEPPVIRQSWWSRLTNWMTTSTIATVKGDNFTRVTYGNRRRNIFTSGFKNKFRPGK